MTVALTPGEEAVIRELRRLRVATMQTLRQRRGCCHMTVVRAIKKTGYHNSFNANAAYYALPETVVFDADGLWFHRQIGFSQHGNLPQTLVALVEKSPAGCTVAELADRLRTPVATLLSRLVRQGRLAVVYHGRRALYLAAATELRSRQEAQRPTLTPAAPVPAAMAGPALPTGVSAFQVIALLSALIQDPGTPVPTLVRRLRQRGVVLTSKQIRGIQAFYDLEKKRHAERGRAGPGALPASRRATASSGPSVRDPHV
jgi:predicted transcriptional regulator